MPLPTTLNWNADGLWRELATLLPGLSLEVVARCESTNTLLIERARRSAGLDETPPSRPGELEPPISGPIPLADSTPHGRRAGDTQPCMLVAEEQTRGRGRLGRPWSSSVGASLTFSLALPYQPPDWSGLSLAIGAALADALDPLLGSARPRITLKWPNDLLLADAGGAGRKLGGILIETVPVGQRRMAVIGIGLNVAPQSTGELSTGFACLQEIQPGVDVPGALAQAAAPLVRAVLQFRSAGFAPFKPLFERRDALKGHRVDTTVAELPSGVAEGIDATGALRLRVGEQLHSLGAGEVSVRLKDEERRC